MANDRLPASEKEICPSEPAWLCIGTVTRRLRSGLLFSGVARLAYRRKLITMTVPPLGWGRMERSGMACAACGK